MTIATSGATDASSATDDVRPSVATTELVLVTGLSGAGKSTAVRCFEEMGYFTVDNMPPALLPTFVELCQQRAAPVEHVAAVVDIRGGAFFADVQGALDQLDEAGIAYRILFLDSQTETLVSRFKEHRFPHPLLTQCDSLLDCIETERRLLSELKARSSVTIDTSDESVRQLRSEIMRLFAIDPAGRGNTVHLITFGFKYGVPSEVDYCFDVRFLANPYYDPELRPRTGEDPSVQAFVDADPRTAEVLLRIEGLLELVLPAHWEEGRRYVSIGVGCTGGKHRSVHVARQLAAFLEGLGYQTVLRHRDLGRE